MWSIEKTKRLRANCLGLPHKHITLLEVSLKTLKLEKPLLLRNIHSYITVIRTWNQRTTE